MCRNARIMRSQVQQSFGGMLVFAKKWQPAVAALPMSWMQDPRMTPLPRRIRIRKARTKESDEGEKESGDSETIQPGEKKECLEPSIVKAAWVYSQSAHAHQVLPVDVGEAPDSSWYPCLVAYNTSDPGCQNVLCKPLLENGCKRPFRTHESRLVHINSHAPHPQNFDHSEEVIEPQPEHFERSTVETMLGGNIDEDDGKPALTGAALGIRKEDVRDRERKEALKLAKKAVRDILVWRCTSNALGLRNYTSWRIDCMRGHGIVDPPSCH